ncbi:MAG: rRNA pseudouridine synthase [Elainella sp. Prado103]|jgi:23S rRNA pseudouridine2605 synthase|nr:rRNA pseudouridine synthase [Elainella sp. Prado103]
MAERLQKILSQWGIASRRQAEQMILEGRVRLNGALGTLGQRADPAVDAIEVDGQPIRPHQRPELTYLLLHKPARVVSTCDDPQGRRTVLDLLSNQWRSLGLHPVGRLDAASTGALLLTNDGAVTACLTHPRHSISKTYQVWVQGHPSPEILRQWRQGVLLDGRPTRRAEVRILATHPTATQLEIILREGRNRQIRRVAEQLGHPVLELHRVAIGSIQLGSLKPGQHRPLYPSEVQFLRQQAQSAQLLLVATSI